MPSGRCFRIEVILERLATSSCALKIERNYFCSLLMYDMKIVKERSSITILWVLVTIERLTFKKLPMPKVTTDSPKYRIWGIMKRTVETSQLHVILLDSQINN